MLMDNKLYWGNRDGGGHSSEGRTILTNANMDVIIETLHYINEHVEESTVIEGANERDEFDSPPLVGCQIGRGGRFEIGNGCPPR